MAKMTEFVFSHLKSDTDVIVIDIIKVPFLG